MSNRKTPPQLVAIIAEQADKIAWLEGEVAGWRIKLAAAEEEIRRLRDELERKP